MITSRGIGVFLSIFGILAASGCDSMKGGAKKKQDRGFYTIPTPQGAGWKRVGEGDSVSFIRVNDATDDDVVTLFVAAEEVGKALISADDVAAHLQVNGGASMKQVGIDNFGGVQGARFMAYQEDTGTGGTQEERESLGLPVREAGMRFYVVRTKGFVFVDPKRPTRLIKVGISRTSFHGFIGAHFESIGEAFMDSFFTEKPAWLFW